MVKEYEQWYQESQARLDVAFQIRDRLNAIRAVLHDAGPETVENAIQANSEIPNLVTQYALLPGTPRRPKMLS